MTLASSKTKTANWRRKIYDWLNPSGASSGQVLTADGSGGTSWTTTGVPTGTVLPFAAETPPTGYLVCNGTAVSITTYSALFDVIGGRYGFGTANNFTVDTTNDEIDDVAHGLSNGTILLLNSTGTLPAGLSADTLYYVVGATTDAFQVSLTEGGSAVDITGTGTGTHSYYTQAKTPDLRGKFVRGFDDGAGNDPDAASRTDSGDGTTGDEVGTLQDDAFQGHHHLSRGFSSGLGGGGSAIQYPSTAGVQDRGVDQASTDSTYGTARITSETRPINVGLQYIIKT